MRILDLGEWYLSIDDAGAAKGWCAPVKIVSCKNAAVVVGLPVELAVQMAHLIIEHYPLDALGNV